MHELGTNKVTEHAISIGIRPPDDRPHCWYIVEEYSPDQTYQGLFWDGPVGVLASRGWSV
jgi:hypothetical protein